MVEYASTSGMQDPKVWFRDIVVPNVREYQQRPCRRTTFNAIVSSHHFIDRIYFWRKEHNLNIFGSNTDSGFRKHLDTNDPDLKMLHDMADSLKHHFLRESTNRNAMVNTATGVIPCESNSYLTPDNRDLGTFLDIVLEKLSQLIGYKITPKGEGECHALCENLFIITAP